MVRYLRATSMLGRRQLLASFAVLAGAGSVWLLLGVIGLHGMPQTESAQQAPLGIERTFESAALGRTMPYTLYLPPGYEANETARYPVLYMLHGLGGNYTTEWRAYGLLDHADTLMRTGVIQPMIIVLPEGETSYWVDHADGGPAWGAYTAEDLVTHIDATVRTIGNPCARAIGGNSMGAHGAMQLALTYPGVFSIVGAHSPTLRTHAESFPQFGDETYFAEHDPRTLMATRRATAQRVRWSIDVGEADPWIPVIQELHVEMEQMQIPHQFAVHPGPHDNEYWISRLDHYLVTYDAAFQANQDGC